MEKANHCISFIVTQIKHLNCNVEHTVRNKHKIHEIEVTESAVKKTNIEKILSDIAESEEILAKGVSFDDIQILCGQYQQVIKKANYYKIRQLNIIQLWEIQSLRSI